MNSIPVTFKTYVPLHPVEKTDNSIDDATDKKKPDIAAVARYTSNGSRNGTKTI